MLQSGKVSNLFHIIIAEFEVKVGQVFDADGTGLVLTICDLAKATGGEKSANLKTKKT